jgi:hypothetical protein
MARQRTPDTKIGTVVAPSVTLREKQHRPRHSHPSTKRWHERDDATSREPLHRSFAHCSVKAGAVAAFINVHIKEAKR